MKNTRRFILGLVTSLFLSVGLVRAAEFSASLQGAEWTAINTNADSSAPHCLSACSWE